MTCMAVVHILFAVGHHDPLALKLREDALGATVGLASMGKGGRCRLAANSRTSNSSSACAITVRRSLWESLL
jgi:hypothetical protein